MSKAIRKAEERTNKLRLDNKVFFTSSSADQVSYEYEGKKMGYFTYFLLQGLSGKAKEVKNPAFVDLNELFVYVKDEVYEATKKKFKKNPQLPGLIFVEGSNIDDFPVSLRE